jgi:CheY-like chemotaxis protein/signal transduction histidine kinase/HAMP domain-containing protein
MMNLTSIKFKLLTIIIGIGVILCLLLAFFSPYQSKNLGKEIMLKDSEFIAKLLSDNLALGMWTLEFDDGAALGKTLDLLKKGEDWTSTISRVKVFNNNLEFIKGLNAGSDISTEYKPSDEIIFDDQGEILKVWSPMLDSDNNKLGYVEIDFSKQFLTSRSDRNSWISLLIAIFALAVTLIPSIYIIRKSVWGIQTVAQAVNELAEGNVDIQLDVQSKDEIGDLANSATVLVSTMKELAKAADAIGQGDYNVPVIIRSDKDILGNAISRMKTNILSVTKENEEQNWLKTGQAELNDKMRGDQGVSELAQNMLNYTASYLDAKVGAVYLKDESGVLKLGGSYAYTKRKNLSNEFKIGEGIVGQSALEKKEILITNIPDDYIKINSGTGEATPLNILVIPLLYDDQVTGVLELGSFQKFTDIHLNYLKQASENIAIAFHSALSRIKVKELLEQTQKQAEDLQSQQEELRVTNEELQSQQEELRVSNEELEEQTKALRASEELLKSQQEELQNSNEGLEAQTTILKERQEEIEKRNKDLEIARQEIAKKARELEITSKYKSEFLANMSHELRTPMNSIQILSRLLSENKEGNLNEKQINFAETIYSSGSDLLGLINEILDLSKIESGKMIVNIDKMSLKNLPSYLEQNFQHLTEQKELYLKVEIDKGLPENIITDRQRVEQIIKNLISNAIKFTKEGGITVRVDRPSASVDLSRSGLDPEKAIGISVNDTGVGIPADKKELIFEAFQQADGTTSRKFGGTGLGLSISRELAKLLKGEIQLESEEGKGSTFTFFLPEAISSEDISQDTTTAKEEPVETEVQLTEKVETQDKKKKTVTKEIKKEVSQIRDDRLDVTEESNSILVVEDDPNFAKILFDLTREKGFKCLIAEDGEAGLQLANQYKPSAIMLDVGLPRIDGWTVMARLKKNPDTRHIPVYFVSAYDKKLDAMKMGAIGYLTKPVSMEKLNSAFTKIENIISKDIKKLLVVEDDKTMRDSILELIGNGDVSITAIGEGKEAYKLLQSKDFDCMVLDLGLSDISGFDLLEKIKGDKKISDIPIIIYTGKELTKKEETKLRKHSESIIVKGAKSPDRLLDEVSLFLHRVESKLPKEKQEKIRILHEDEDIFENKKILLVDDDVRNIFALSSVLEEKDIKIESAENGKEALEALKNNPDIDLVLMDIMMPEMDGYEAMKEIRKQRQYSKLPIIALTAKAMKGDRQKCIAAGANDYLAKPVNIEKLLSLLQVWLYK